MAAVDLAGLRKGPAAKLFEKGIPGLLIQGRYAYGFVQQVVDIPHNRSLGSLEAAVCGRSGSRRAQRCARSAPKRARSACAKTSPPMPAPTIAIDGVFTAGNAPFGSRT